MLMDMCLPKFEIYQITVAPNCVKSYTSSSCPDLFQKTIFSDVQSQTDLGRCNMVSTGQSVRDVKEYIIQA